MNTKLLLAAFTGLSMLAFIAVIVLFVKKWNIRYDKNIDAISEDNTKSRFGTKGIGYDPTYKEKPIPLKYFDIEEFDSKSADGDKTGQLMHISTLKKLDKARELAGLPFKINSGFRTVAHNAATEGAVKNSAHTRGYAADIAVNDKTVEKILWALRQVGFNRFGVYRSWVHVDNDPDKDSFVVWRQSPLTTTDPLGIEVSPENAAIKYNDIA